MKTIKLSEASRPLADYAAELDDQVLVLTHDGRPVAAVVPLSPADRESVMLSGHPDFQSIVAASRADVTRRRTVPLAEMRGIAAEAGGASTPSASQRPRRRDQRRHPKRRDVDRKSRGSSGR